MHKLTRVLVVFFVLFGFVKTSSSYWQQNTQIDYFEDIEDTLSYYPCRENTTYKDVIDSLPGAKYQDFYGSETTLYIDSSSSPPSNCGHCVPSCLSFGGTQGGSRCCNNTQYGEYVYESSSCRVQNIHPNNNAMVFLDNTDSVNFEDGSYIMAEQQAAMCWDSTEGGGLCYDENESVERNVYWSERLEDLCIAFADLGNGDNKVNHWVVKYQYEDKNNSPSNYFVPVYKDEEGKINYTAKGGGISCDDNGFVQQDSKAFSFKKYKCGNGELGSAKSLFVPDYIYIYDSYTSNQISIKKLESKDIANCNRTYYEERTKNDCYKKHDGAKSGEDDTGFWSLQSVDGKSAGDCYFNAETEYCDEECYLAD